MQQKVVTVEVLRVIPGLFGSQAITLRAYGDQGERYQLTFKVGEDGRLHGSGRSPGRVWIPSECWDAMYMRAQEALKGGQL